MFFCCRCGGVVFLLLSSPGARFVCCRCGGALFFAVVAVPGVLSFAAVTTHREVQRQQKKAPGTATTAKNKTRPGGRHQKKNVPPQRPNKKQCAPQRQQKATTAKKKTLLPMETSFLFDVVAGAVFFCCRGGNRGSLTHWLPGSAQREQKQHKSNDSKKKHGFPRFGQEAFMSQPRSRKFAALLAVATWLQANPGPALLAAPCLPTIISWRSSVQKHATTRNQYG